MDLVRDKVNWGPSEKWTDKYFKKLSNMIFDDTGYTISPNTLKRLLGKIKIDFNSYSPHDATKDALAHFVGYETWDKYKKAIDKDGELVDPENDSEKRIDDQPDTSETQPGSTKKIVLVVAGLAIGIALFFLFSKNDEGEINQITGIDADKVSITSDELGGVVPFTQVVKVDVSEYPDDTFKLTGIELPINVDNDEKIYHIPFTKPGRKSIVLERKGELVKSLKLFAESKYWEFGFSGDQTQFLGIHDKENEQTLFASVQEDEKYQSVKGYAYASYFKRFQVNGENLQFDFYFKSKKKYKTIQCNDVAVVLVGQSGRHRVHIPENGCEGYFSMTFGDKKIKGVHEDLDLQGVKLDTPNHLSLSVENKNFTVFLNDKELVKGVYEKPIGEVLSIEMSFGGIPYVDSLSLKDSDQIFSYSFTK